MVLSELALADPILVPPIKSQGIKTKLVPWIRSVLGPRSVDRWIEPFMGTGVVGFNVSSSATVMGDSNPHLVAFYRHLRDGIVDGDIVRIHLEHEGALLASRGESHYYEVRERFNARHHPLDFLFLSRAGFNGMIRFNRSGEFNIPFCRKPERFAPAYVTKIVNQVERVRAVMMQRPFDLWVQDFEATVAEAGPNDLIYCDPPYAGRHTDYYNGWTGADEQRLSRALAATPAAFVVSTWARNRHRENDSLRTIWADFDVLEREHFYHVGARVENRGSMTEALVCSPGLLDRSGATAVRGARE